MNIVCKRDDVLLKGLRVLESDFDKSLRHIFLEPDHVSDCPLLLIQVRDIRRNAAFKVKTVETRIFEIPFRTLRALIHHGDRDPPRQVRLLPKVREEGIQAEFECRKNLGIGHKGDLRAMFIRLPDFLHRTRRLSTLVFLHMHIPIAIDLRPHVRT